MAGSSSAHPDGAPPGLLRLHLTFMRIAFLSFGGGSTLWAHRVLVERLRWLSDAEFLAAIGLCQVLPGPNLINLSVAVGTQYRGLAGALSAVAGTILLPLAVMIGAGMLYFHFQDAGPVRAALAGMSAAAAGTAIASAVKVAQPYDWSLRRAALALIAFGAIALFQIPLVTVLAVMLPLGFALAWYDHV